LTRLTVVGTSKLHWCTGTFIFETSAYGNLHHHHALCTRAHNGVSVSANKLADTEVYPVSTGPIRAQFGSSTLRKGYSHLFGLICAYFIMDHYCLSPCLQGIQHVRNWNLITYNKIYLDLIIYLFIIQINKCIIHIYKNNILYIVNTYQDSLKMMKMHKKCRSTYDIILFIYIYKLCIFWSG